MDKFLPNLPSSVTFKSITYHAHDNESQFLPTIDINPYLMNVTDNTQTTVEYSDFNPIEELVKPIWFDVIVTTLYVILFILGFVGNAMVILVVCRDRKMASSTNVFLVNLSVADLSVIVINLPAALLEFHAEEVWYLGDAMCRIVAYLENVAVHASAITIVAISFERYYAICCPLKAQYVCTLGRTIKILIAIWIFTLLWTSPFLTMAKTSQNFHLKQQRWVDFCITSTDARWRRAYIVTNLVIFFIIPVLILAVLYGGIIKCLVSTHSSLLDGQALSASARKQRKQVVIMLLSVITLFFVCLLPFRAFAVWQTLANDSSLENLGFIAYMTILNFSRVAFYLNSAGNPILYNLFSTKFRQAFIKLCSCCRGINRRGSENVRMHSNGNYCYKQSFRTPLRESTSVTKVEF